jgi:single-strand DNA-binding protein
MGVNKVILVGNLGKNPELRVTTKGIEVCNFSIATSETWKDKTTGEKKERTEWHRIVAWDKLGKNCAEHLSKGRQVYVEGKIQTRSYEDKLNAGRKLYITEVVANEVQFLGKKMDGGNTRDDVPPLGDDDIPF